MLDFFTIIYIFKTEPGTDFSVSAKQFTLISMLLNAYLLSTMYLKLLLGRYNLFHFQTKAEVTFGIKILTGH